MTTRANKRQNYPARTIPATGISHDQRRLQRLGLDSSQRVAVFWPTGPDTCTLVGYYSTVSAANTAAAAAVNADGAYPTVFVNWWHSTITFKSVGPILHRDAQTALPSWIDADPAY